MLGRFFLILFLNAASWSEKLAIGFNEKTIAKFSRSGWKVEPSLTGAEIVHSRDGVTLMCSAGKDSPRIIWFFYKCPKPGLPVGGVELSPMNIIKRMKQYELQQSQIAGNVTSSLRIRRGFSEEVAGLYRCDAGGVMHYFIVGRREELKTCFPGSASFLQTIRNFVRVIDDGRSRDSATYEYILKMPGSSNEYKIRFSVAGYRKLTERTGNLHVFTIGESDAVDLPEFLRGKRSRIRSRRVKLNHLRHI